jgi:outer membrane protein TolC
MWVKLREWGGNVTGALDRLPLCKRSLGGARSTALIPRAFYFGLALLFTSAAACFVHAQATLAQATPQAPVQLVYPPKPAAQTGPPVTITLADALERAQKNSAEYLSAISDQKSAHEDRLQARNARLPQVGFRSEYLGTQGNGITPNGRFVTNDGVHVYREWGTLHQDVTANVFLGTDYKRAQAAEAIAAAKAEIARRGLTVTVTKAFYALVVAQRKYATAQEASEQSRRFLQLTEDTERAGQAAHSDVIKAQIQYQQQETAFTEANLGMESARLDLSVLIFPTLDENFTAVDDLDTPRPLLTFGEAQEMAARTNPDLRVAMETLRQSNLDVRGAQNAFLPIMSFDPVWGLEANCVATHCVYTAIPEAGSTPTLGYMIQATLTIPLWDWGTLRSKLRQADFRQEQAQVSLSQTQRRVLAELYAAYNEALVAREEVDKLRQTADLAGESLRLVTLRYQGGSSTSLEVVDAQTTLIAARNAYDDAQVRYRNALATLQTFTGSF